MKRAIVTATITLLVVISACGEGDGSSSSSTPNSSPSAACETEVSEGLHDPGEDTRPPHHMAPNYTVDCGDEGFHAFDQEAHDEAVDLAISLIYTDNFQRYGVQPTCIRPDGYGGHEDDPACEEAGEPQDEMRHYCLIFLEDTSSHGKIACEWHILGMVQGTTCTYEVACVPEARRCEVGFDGPLDWELCPWS